MFLVTVEGVYRHEVLGLFSTEDQAEKVAILYALKEKDGYHDLWVSRMEMDKEIENIEPIFMVVTKDLKRNYEKNVQSRRIVKKFSEKYDITLLELEDEAIRNV